MESDKNTEEAFRWIVGILKKHSIPFQVTGGCAAQVYGAKRPLLDIDIDVPNDRLNELLPDVKDTIVFGPNRDIMEGFDVLVMRLDYHGQQIDVSGATDVRIYDSDKKEWVECSANLTNSEDHEVFGITAPVVKKQDLIAYKKLLKRDVDIEDLKYLTSGK